MKSVIKEIIEIVREELIEKTKCKAGAKADDIISMIESTNVVIRSSNRKALATAIYHENKIELRKDADNFQYDFLKEILVHEFMHIICDEINKERVVQAHGKEYKNLFVFYGYPREWGMATCTPRFINEVEEDVKYKYIAKCSESDHWEIKYMRKGNVVKNPSAYSCPKCGGKVIIETV